MSFFVASPFTDADAAIRVSSWRCPAGPESAGVDAERAEAKRLRLPVRFYHPIEDGYRWNWIGEETAREAVA